VLRRAARDLAFGKGVARCDRVMSSSDLTTRGWRGLTIALLILCAPGMAVAQTPSPPTADPVAGARLFRARGCTECHGADLARFRAQPRPLFALTAAMWNHFPVMAERIRTAKRPTPYLTSSELRDLVAFLRSESPERRASDDPRLLGDLGDAGRGRQLVTDKGCLECHALSGPGGKRAGSLDALKGLDSPWTVAAQMWNHAFLMELETQGQRVPWVRLSATDMADLVAFLQALMRAR
jgi:mono/diheme cytochrome c family protein